MVQLDQIAGGVGQKGLAARPDRARIGHLHPRPRSSATVSSRLSTRAVTEAKVRADLAHHGIPIRPPRSFDNPDPRQRRQRANVAAKFDPGRKAEGIDRVVGAAAG